MRAPGNATRDATLPTILANCASLASATQRSSAKS